MKSHFAKNVEHIFTVYYQVCQNEISTFDMPWKILHKSWFWRLIHFAKYSNHDQQFFEIFWPFTSCAISDFMKILSWERLNKTRWLGNSWDELGIKKWMWLWSVAPQGQAFPQFFHNFSMLLLSVQKSSLDEFQYVSVLIKSKFSLWNFNDMVYQLRLFSRQWVSENYLYLEYFLWKGSNDIHLFHLQEKKTALHLAAQSGLALCVQVIFIEWTLQHLEWQSSFY